MSRRAGQLLASDVFLALATKNWLRDVRTGDREIIEQITMAREYDKPCFLIYVDLSDDDVAEIERMFSEHRLIDTLRTTRNLFQRDCRIFVGKVKKWCEAEEGSPE